MNNYDFTADLKYSEAFFSIIKFYLFQCPVTYTPPKKEKIFISKRGRSFEKLGINKNELNLLIKMMKKDLNGKIYDVARIMNIEDEEEKIRIEKGLKDEYFEYVVFVNNSQMGKCKSIFYMIRNSFAHGSFNIKKNNNENYYYLESSKSNSIKAIMCLKEKTLIKWINDVKTKDFIKKKK